MGKPPVAALLGLLLLAGGCGGLPADGEVSVVRRVNPPDDSTGDLDEPATRRLIPDPEIGASPVDIVRGFLDAHADARGDYQTARKYLSSGTAWDERANVTVYESRQFSSGEETAGRIEVSVIVQQVALVQQSSYRPVRQTRTLEFELALNGEWRIVRTPDGVLISDSDFTGAYTRAVRYFADARGRSLVPDPVFLPAGVEPARGVVDALLAGPADSPLAGAVRSGAPDRTQAVSVDVVEGVATVNLSREANRAAQDARRLLLAQLTYALTEPGLGANEVRVLVEGQPLDVADHPGGSSVRRDWRDLDPEEAPPDARVHALRGDDVVEIDGPTVTVVRDLPGARALAVSRDATVLAALKGNSVVLADRDGSPLRTVLTGTGLTAPAFSSDGVWVVRDGSLGPQEVQLISTATPSTAQRVGASLQGRIVALRIAPGGTRAALVVRRGNTGVVYVARIERAGSNAPSLAGPYEVPVDGVDVVDVGWAESGRLTGVGRSDGKPAAFGIDVDGFGLTRLSVDGLPDVPSSLAAAPRRASLVAVGGQLYQLREQVWERAGAGTAPAYA